MGAYLCDTSCLVATVCSWHEHHEITRIEIERRSEGGEELVLAAHSLAETFAVLTRLPSPHRLRPSDARSVLEANWAKTELVHLTGGEIWRALREAETRGMSGGQTYDVLVTVAALKAGCETLLTWNLTHFVPFQDAIEVLAPGQTIQ